MDKIALRRDLATALTLHIHLLQEVEEISEENMEAFTFMMRSFGFMLDRAPAVLYEEKDEDDLNYMMFQYYSLLTELKYNILMSFPYATLNGRRLLELAEDFPTTYEKELKNWWEEKTGLHIEETKQTILIEDFSY
ncbi:hypothetical protein [Enterococcus nangangensis]|uniref:hypothetical protein n=1 Tax=Enterococcus nangangensis TaxID=2559926 RepID=UPI0010F6FB5B|nr:hypothetical protein [Enterococcus nangangensis]